MGPFGTPLKEAYRISVMPYWISGSVRAILDEVPGIVVVVEDNMPEYLPKRPVRLDLFHGGLRLVGSQRPGFSNYVPAPDWMNSSVTRAGGNVVQRTYTFGGVGF